MRMARAAMVGLGLMLAVGLWLPGVRAAAQADYSGNWTGDLKASDFGEVGSPDHVTMNVTHKEPEITVHYDLGLAGNPVVWDATCKTDGSECKSKTGDVTLSFKWEGPSLTLNRAMSFGGMAIKMKETWTLSADGKTLTSSRAIATPQGDTTQKVVFTKS
jgi:hypothetical protein